MRIGYKPYRAVVTREDIVKSIARDLEAKDLADAKKQAEEQRNEDAKISSVAALPEDEVRTYRVQLRDADWGVIASNHIRAKSSVEAERIAMAQVSLGEAVPPYIVPLVELATAMPVV